MPVIDNDDISDGEESEVEIVEVGDGEADESAAIQVMYLIKPIYSTHSNIIVVRPSPERPPGSLGQANLCAKTRTSPPTDRGPSPSADSHSPPPWFYPGARSAECDPSGLSTNHSNIDRPTCGYGSPGISGPIEAS